MRTVGDPLSHRQKCTSRGMTGRLDLGDTAPVPDGYLVAMPAAARRIVPLRNKMTIEHAQDIVRVEFERQDIHLSGQAIERHARALHTKPLNPWPHPFRARAAE